MATLTRPKTAPSPSDQASLLSVGVPAPFPQEELYQIQLTGSSATQFQESTVPAEQVRDDWTENEEQIPQEESASVLVSSLPRCCSESFSLTFQYRAI